MNLSQYSLFHSRQHTLAAPVAFRGVGLHGGAPARMRLLPAAPGAGILFRRLDVEDGRSPKADIPARYDAVSATMLGTTLANGYGVTVATVEHLTAALWGMGVDNVLVELDGPEVPIMDGSSAAFVRAIGDAGVKAQTALRRVLKIESVVAVRDGEATAELAPGVGFTLDIAIDFGHAAIPRQRARYDFRKTSFAETLSRARTFGFTADVARLRAMGLARGGSLANAVVLDETGVLNEEGLRYDDEFLRHKALDCVGDYFLAGMRIEGRVVTNKPGHAINNRLMRALLAQPSAWSVARGFGDAAAPVPAAAYAPRALRVGAG